MLFWDGLLCLMFYSAFCTTCVSALTAYDSSQLSEESVQKGKEAYQQALRESKSRIPEYGHCWKNALKQLDEGCRQLTDETQHSLALSFLNCFLLSTGKEHLICNKPHYIDCTKDFDNSLVQLHNNYFIHTQNMCSFLQLQIWHDKTEETISRLATASSDTAKKLLESSEQQEKLLSQQSESLTNQDKIMQSGNQLEKVLESSTSGVKAIFDEYKKTTKEQRLLITDVFDRVSSLQNLVLGEFTSLYSLIFYVLSISISYLVTSTPRTSGARFWLFLLMTADIFVERLIVSWCGVDSHTSVNDTNVSAFHDFVSCSAFHKHDK
jgi:3-methyladenine DNA glycosylase AlkC